MMEKKVCLIGVGLVGTALAENLIAAGYEVTGYDISPERLDLLTRLGGKTSVSPCEAASGRTRVILSLPDSDTVRQVLFGTEGVLAGRTADRAGTNPRFVIDTTTGDPDATVQTARLCAARGVAYLDATISGSSAQIRRREGVFMVGAEAEAFAACRDIFAALAGKFFHVGEPGSGARTKLAVNLILGLNRLALAEGLVLAEGMGLDLERFLDLLKDTAAYSRVMDAKGTKMLRRDFAPEARLAQHAKDVALILAQAAKAGLKLPLSSAHYQVLQAAIAAGDGELDNSAVIRQLRRR